MWKIQISEKGQEIRKDITRIKMAIAKIKKRFFDIEIPIIQKETQLQALEQKDLNNRIIRYDMTRILRGKSMILQLKTKVEGDKIIAVPQKAQILPYFLRRMLRKGTNYVEDSFIAECNDAEVRIKPFLITRRKVSRAIRAALRNKAKEELINYVKNKDSEKLFLDIIDNHMQKTLSSILKKIYPLSLCEIRIFQVVKEKRA
jgi:ribosomal protein S3AE